MKAKKIFAFPRHPIKIGPRAYDGSRLVPMVLFFAKPVDHAVCRGGFGERTLFLGLILVSMYKMHFARFGRRTYHSFQSMYQVSRKEGFPSFFRVLGRCIWGETTDHRAGKTQQHMLESLQIKEEPHLGIQKPVKGNNMPLWRMNESLIWRMNEPLIWRMIEPLCRMNEVHSSSKSSEIDCINTHQNQAEYSCLFLRLRTLNGSTLHKIRSLRLTECYIVCLLCFMFHFIFSAVSSLRSAVCSLHLSDTG